MQSHFITFQEANDAIDKLLEEKEITRLIDKISVLDLSTVTAYIEMINVLKENLNLKFRDRLINHQNWDLYYSLKNVHNKELVNEERKRYDQAALDKNSPVDKIKSLLPLLFYLKQRHRFLKENIQKEQFLLFATLSDEMRKFEHTDESKMNNPQWMLQEARERVTLEVLGNHENLMTKTRELIADKEKLEKELKEKDNQIIEHAELIQSLADESKKSQADVGLLRNQVQEQLKLIQELTNNLKEQAAEKKSQMESVATLSSTPRPPPNNFSSKYFGFGRKFGKQ